MTTEKAAGDTARPEREQLHRRNRELAILNQIAQELNRAVDLDEALQSTLARMLSLFDLQTGWIWLLRQETGVPYLAAARQLPPALAGNPERMAGGCYCLDTYRAGDLDGAANVNVITCSRLSKLVDGTDGLRYHASIPLYAHGKKIGVMNVASENWRELAPEDLRLLYTVGDMLGMAIERLRLYSRSVEMGATEERNRLAREIHDTLAQGLAAVALQLESADALLEAGGDAQRARQAVERALRLTRANLEEARRSVMDLRAAPLEGQTLVGALVALARQFEADEGVTVKLTTAGAHRPLPVRVETGLYRIVQEALANVGRHARATEVTIRLLTTPDEIRLLVADDGRGFDPREVDQDRYGLVGLSERAKLLGGRFHLETAPAAGTRLEVLIPMTAI